MEGPNVNDIQIMRTWREWVRLREEFEKTEALEREITNQQKSISKLELAYEQEHGYAPQELSIAFSETEDLEYPIALFRQIAVMHPIDIDRFLSYQLHLVDGDEKNVVLFILQLEEHVITRLRLFPSAKSHERLQMVLDWSNRVKDRFIPYQKELYFKWPKQEQHFNSTIEVQMLSKLQNRIKESEFKQFVALLKRKNAFNGEPIMTAEDFELFIQVFEIGRRSHLQIKKLHLNLCESDAAVFFRLLWMNYFAKANSQNGTKLGIVELCQLVIDLFPGVYGYQADSFDKLSRNTLYQAENIRPKKNTGATSSNIMLWLNWLKGKRSGNSNKS